MITIRAASLGEVPKVLTLLEYGVLEGALLQRTTKELKSIARKGNLMAAFDGDLVVGVVMLDFYSGRMSEMRSLYVMREYRNTKIGSRLVRNVVKRARELGVEELMTITLKKNMGWFVNRGFGEDPHGFKVALFRDL